MIRNKIFALLFVLFFVPQSLYATVHPVSHNEAIIIELQDNDEIELINLPAGWGYSRIAFGVNSVPALQLSGRLVVNDCDHELHSYYEEFDISYTGVAKIVYHGPTQRLPIQWWVDANPVVSSCKSYSELLRKDSIATMLYDFADSIYSEKIKDYKDLGELNSETLFEGTSAKFKITDLPSWFYNRIYVLVESLDGRELSGAAYVGKGKIEIKGFSEKVAIEQKTMLAPTFELAFPEYRRVKLKWWAEVQVHSEFKIESKEVSITSDSVEVEYTFGDNFYSKSSVKLAFNKRKFVDGKVPVVKKLSFNPQGPDKSREPVVRGDIYDFDAKLNPGDSVVIAIPLDFDYQSSKDSVTIEHFIKEENRWIEHPVDSIVDNYAYIKVGHFSWFRKLCRAVVSAVVYVAVPGAAVCSIISKDCHEAVSTFIDNTADVIADAVVAVADGMKWVYNVMKSLVCGDFDQLKKLFGSPKSSSWSIDQGSVDVASMKSMGLDVISELIRIRSNQELKKIQQCVEPCQRQYVENLDDTFAYLKLAQFESQIQQCVEVCQWNSTKENLDVILADAVLSQFDPQAEEYGSPRYKFEYDSKEGKGTFIDTYEQNKKYDYDDYFAVSSSLVNDAAWYVKGIKKCIGSINLTGGVVQDFVDMYEGMKNLSWPKFCNALFGFQWEGVEWVSNVADCVDFAIDYKDLRSGHEGKLIAISEAMVRISLLAWLKKADDFRNYTLLRYKVAYDGIRAWLELAGPFLNYNNIATKAYGSLALFEYIHYGTDENLKMVNGGLNRHYGDNGGFSEGMGYSQYIWDDLTYVLAALKDAYKLQNETFEINGKFLKSPDYVFEFSRPVGAKDGKHYGLIPVEADDGVTYNPDYRVWAKLKDDPKYLAMSEKYPLKPSDGKINPLVAFGFPEESMNKSNEKILPNRGNLWSDFKDGIGMITAVVGNEDGDKDTVSLSMIAENGNMWTRGQAHDQQDNLSITLTSSKKGFLIQDPGYTGFEARSTRDGFHRYYDHNVLTTDYGQDDNREIPFADAWSRAYDFTGDFPGLTTSLLLGLWKLFDNAGYDLSVEGGEPADILDKKINEPENGIIGFTAKTRIGPSSSDRKDYNKRTIMYFGENFWVVDRPETKWPDAIDLKWCANSPMDDWILLNLAGVHLYRASKYQELNLSAYERKILQNGSRSDFENGNDLINYFYYAYGGNDTFVMTYELNGEKFIKTGCMKDFQCFANSSNNMKVIVPPNGKSFKLCDVLPVDECSGNARSTGITMLAKTPLGEWVTRWVLDGDLWAGKKGLDFKIASATVSRTSYIYQNLDGTSVTGMHTGTYLPALPILLLR